MIMTNVTILTKARKNMFFASRRPPHTTQVSQERFWDKSEKSVFDDDFDFWGTIFGIPFVENP